MASNQHVMDQLLQERASIVKSGHLHWVHWLVVGLSLVLTIGAWHYVKKQINEKTVDQFERYADQVLELISERMQKYEDGLWGGVSAIQAQGGNIGYEEWRVFAENLRIDLKYPGINGIGVIHHVPPENLEAYLEDQRRSRPDYRIHPPHDKAWYLPITYIEPSSENAKAVGLDMAHEANRYGAALRARDTGRAQITGPIVLVQDEDHTPGFLFYAPFYKDGTYASVQDRRDQFVGMVYAPFVFHKLMEGVLGKEKRQVRIRVTDVENVLYDEQDDIEEDYDHNPVFSRAYDLDLYGRTWTFQISTTKSFREATSSDQPTFILLGGITIDALLFTLFVLLTRANRRAVDFTDRMTGELQTKATALEDLNAGLEKIEGQLRLVLDTTTNGIIGMTGDGQIVIANPTARDLLGGIASGTPCAWPSTITFLDEENLEPLEASKDPIQRSLAGQELKAEINLMSHRGTPDQRYVRISSAQVTSPNTEVVAVVVLDDVSEQERNRQQVERSSRLDALGQLTGGIAHDFNNLLATIQYALDLSITDDIPHYQRGFLETAARSVERGSKLTNRLLAFAKRQPGLAMSRRVDQILDEFRSLAIPTIEEAIELVFPEPDPGLHVFCDTAQLENALLNLVLNSRDAILRSGKGNRIEILVRLVDEADASAAADNEQTGAYTSIGMKKEQDADRERDDRRSHRYVEIAISDNGPGMSKEVKRRALDPFFTTKATNSGTGLGLSMVYGFVQQSNGELRIYSEEGHGTSVRMRLPSASASGTREEPVQRAVRVTGDGQCILIVEDEEGLRAMMEAQVEALGYQALAAASGEDALRLAGEGAAFDLLLTDIVMPGKIGGFKLAGLMREKRPKLPIIYMSGYAGFKAEDMGNVVGPLLQKPCPPAELALALHEALNGRSEAA